MAKRKIDYYDYNEIIEWAGYVFIFTNW